MKETTSAKQAGAGGLFAVYCPYCREVTDKVSFNLLREAGRVVLSCHECGQFTQLIYDGGTVRVSHSALGFV